MSSVWKRPKYTPKQQENNWMNLLWNSHDQFCNCDDPLLHFMVLVNKDSPCRKPVSEIENVKCLLTGDTSTKEDTTNQEDETGFIDGELEKLFDENGENQEEDSTNQR